MNELPANRANGSVLDFSICISSIPFIHIEKNGILDIHIEKNGILDIHIEKNGMLDIHIAPLQMVPRDVIRSFAYKQECG